MCYIRFGNGKLSSYQALNLKTHFFLLIAVVTTKEDGRGLGLGNTKYVFLFKDNNGSRTYVLNATDDGANIVAAVST